MEPFVLESKRNVQGKNKRDAEDAVYNSTISPLIIIGLSTYTHIIFCEQTVCFIAIGIRYSLSRYDDLLNLIYEAQWKMERMTKVISKEREVFKIKVFPILFISFIVLSLTESTPFVFVSLIRKSRNRKNNALHLHNVQPDRCTQRLKQIVSTKCIENRRNKINTQLLKTVRPSNAM